MTVLGRMVQSATAALRGSHLTDEERIDVALALASEIDDPAKLAELVRRAARLQAIQLKGRKVHVTASLVHAEANRLCGQLRGDDSERGRLEAIL